LILSTDVLPRSVVDVALPLADGVVVLFGFVADGVVPPVGFVADVALPLVDVAVAVADVALRRVDVAVAVADVALRRVDVAVVDGVLPLGFDCSQSRMVALTRNGGS